MMRMLIIPLGLLVTFLTASAEAQDIKATLDSASRTVAWAGNVGVPDGIPNRATICQTLNPGASASQINSAISNCPSGQVVFLNAGTYTLSGGITFTGKQQVTLRGAGAHQTKLVFSGGIGCGPGSTAICLGNANATYFAYDGVSHTNWTGGYTRGATQITVASTSNIQIGQMITLDQLQDTSDTGGMVVSSCPGGSANRCPSFFVSNEASAGGWNMWGRGVCATTCSSSSIGERGQIQVVTVTAINGNVLTISPSLYATNWRSAMSPQVWYFSTPANQGYYNGVENLTVDTLSNGVNTSVTAYACYACWAKGIRTIAGSSQTQHIYSFQSARTEFRNNYLYGTSTSSTGNYGIVPLQSSDVLIINNIAHHMSSGLISSTHSGTVIAYNYAYDPALEGNSWMQNMLQNHGADYYVLSEGNDINAHLADNLHGAAPFLTDVRNYFSGTFPGKSTNTAALSPTAWRRGNNYVGNVLGTPGYHNHYQDCVSPSPCATPLNSGNPDEAIWVIGYPNTGTSSGQAGYDAKTFTTMVRWGNCDSVTGFAACRFNASEVSPAGALPFMPAVAMPAVQSIPATFFLSDGDRLRWWCYGTTAGNCTSPAWPPIGPDVTGGNVPNTGGRANKIPARLCFEAMADDPTYGGAVRLFNPQACYQGAGGSTSNPPPAPTGLTVQ